MLKFMADEIAKAFNGVYQWEGESDQHFIYDMFQLAADQWQQA